MRKRKLLLTFAFMIVVVALFAVTEVIGQTTCANFVVTFDGVEVLGSGGCRYTWSLEAGRVDLNNISILEFAIGDGIDVVETDKVDQHPTWEGGQGSYKYAQNLPLSVITITPQPGTGTEIPITFDTVGNNCGTSQIGVHTQAGNKNEVCYSEGPSIGAVTPYASCPSQTRIEIDGVEWCADNNPQTCCPDPNNLVVYKCDDTSVTLQVDQGFTVNAQGTTHKLLWIAGDGGDPRCEMKAIHLNPCQYIELFGQPFGPIPGSC